MIPVDDRDGSFSVPGMRHNFGIQVEAAGCECGSHHAMARHPGREGIAFQRLADGLAGAAVEFLCDHGQGLTLPHGMLRSASMDTLLKGSRLPVHGAHHRQFPHLLVRWKLAEPTRLELATSAVTGRRSNRLSYSSKPDSLSGSRSGRK